MCGVGSWVLVCNYCNQSWGTKWQDIGTVLPYNYENGKLEPCHALGNGTVGCFVKWRRRDDDTCGADPTKFFVKTCDKDECQEADRRAMKQMECIKASQEARRERKEPVAYLSRVRELVEGAAAEDEDLLRRHRTRTPEARFRTQQQKLREGMAFLADSGDQFTLRSGRIKPALHLDKDMGEWDRARQQRRRDQQAQEQQFQQQQNMEEGHSGNSDSQHDPENNWLDAILQQEEDMERNGRIDDYI